MKSDKDSTSLKMIGSLREKIHKLFLNNTSVKICSVILAIFIWAIIINIDDPLKTRTFTVDVETINENALKSVNKVYEIIEGNVAVVKVRGRKSVVDKLESYDIRATADLSNLSSVNAVAIKPSLRKVVQSEITLECEQVLKVSLEDRASRQFKVNVVANGTPDDGYTLGECTARPNMIEVAGGESAISRISYINVFLNVNGASEDFSKRLVPVAYDEEGNEVKSSTLSFGTETIKVFAHILEEKAVNVKIKISGKPANGYQYVSTDCLPEKVFLAGTSKKLKGISEITIPIDISGMTSTSSKLEQNIYISDYLPEGVSAVEGSETVSVKITIEQIIKKNIDVNVSAIKFRSVGNGYEAEIIGNELFVSVLIEGRASVVNRIRSDNVSAYINCNGLDEGTYTLPVLLDNLEESCEIVDETKLKIKIKKSDDEVTNEPDSTERPLWSPTRTPAATTAPPNIEVPAQTDREEVEDEEEE